MQDSFSELVTNFSKGQDDPDKWRSAATLLRNTLHFVTLYTNSSVKVKKRKGVIFCTKLSPVVS